MARTLIQTIENSPIIYYVAARDNKYGAGVHTCLNAILHQFDGQEDGLRASYDFVIKTAPPVTEVYTDTRQVPVNVADIPVEVIVNGVVTTEEFPDPMSGNTFHPSVMVGNVAVPHGTIIPEGATTITVTETFTEGVEKQVSAPLLPSENQGYAHHLVIDENGSLTVRVKNTNENLIDYKPIKIDSIKNTHLVELTKGFMTSFGFRIDCKKENIEDFNLQLSRLEQNPSITEVMVVDYNDEEHVLSRADFITMVVEVGEYYFSLYGRKWLGRKSVLQAESIAAVDAVTF